MNEDAAFVSEGKTSSLKITLGFVGYQNKNIVERFQLGMGIPHRKFGQQIGKVTFHLICPDDAAGFCVGWDTAQFALIVKEDAAMEAAFRKFQQRGEQQNVFSVLYHRIVKGLAISQVIEARPGGCFNLTMDNTILVTLKKHKQPLLMQQQKAAVDALQGCAHLGLQLQQMKMTSQYLLEDLILALSAFICQ